MENRGSISVRGRSSATGAEQSVSRSPRFARLPYVLGPSVTPLAEPRKRVRRRGLTLRVTRRRCRSHDASPNPSFCHARVVYSIG
jgi:hypothetical protein